MRNRWPLDRPNRKPPADQPANFLNLNTGRGVLGGMTEFQAQTIVGASNPNWSLLSAVLAGWKTTAKIQGVSVNLPPTLGDAFTTGFIRCCYDNQLIFWQRGLDDGPSGVTAFVSGASYSALTSAYSDARIARMHITNYLKASNHTAGIAYLKGLVSSFWSIAQQFGDCVWLSLGNEPENWYQHVFRGNRTPPFSGGAETGSIDGSKYGGYMQITDEGQVSPSPATARSKFETAFGHSAPTDANIRLQIPISNATIRGAWGNSNFISGTNHGYYESYGSNPGEYYWGETGDSTNVEVYSEFGTPLDITTVSPYTVLAKPPSGARIIVYWPDGAGSSVGLNILNDASYATISHAKATALAI